MEGQGVNIETWCGNLQMPKLQAKKKQRKHYKLPSDMPEKNWELCRMDFCASGNIVI